MTTSNPPNAEVNIYTANIPAPVEEDGWQTKTIIIGTALGAALGLGASWLLVRTSREMQGGPPGISTGDALRLGITTIGLVRAIAALGDDN